MAVLFAREGCDVTIVFLPEEEDDAKETKSMVEKEGKKCVLVALDLSNFEAAQKVVEDHVKTFGTLDILVNNASRQIFCKDVAKIDLSIYPWSMKLITRGCRADVSNKHRPDVCHDQICVTAFEEGLKYH